MAARLYANGMSRNFSRRFMEMLIHLRSRAAVAMESLNSHEFIFVCVWTIPLQINTTITVEFVWKDELLIKSYW